MVLNEAKDLRSRSDTGLFDKHRVRGRRDAHPLLSEAMKDAALAVDKRALNV